MNIKIPNIISFIFCNLFLGKFNKEIAKKMNEETRKVKEKEVKTR
jgi:hypothetical protein